MFAVYFSGYLAALLLHGLRLRSRLPSNAWRQGLVWIAFVLHTGHLAYTARAAVRAHGAPLSNWHDWCLVGAWLIAAAYLLVGKTVGREWQGIAILPFVVGLLGLAQLFPQADVFASADAYRLWGLLHGCCLLLGTVASILGFSSGMMYLLQADRLKRKLAPLTMRLPSLEALERANEQLFVWSVFFLMAGILSGVVLNLVDETESLPWNDPAVLITGVLLLWLLAAGVFNIFYRPARVGRKVAYLTVSSFSILALTLAFVWFSPTAHLRQEVGAAASGNLPRPPGDAELVTR